MFNASNTVIDECLMLNEQHSSDCLKEKENLGNYIKFYLPKECLKSNRYSRE